MRIPRENGKRLTLINSGGGGGGGGQRPVMSSEKKSSRKREASHKNIINYIFGYSSLSVV